MQLQKSLNRGGKTLDLNLFENRKTEDNFISKFVEELKDVYEKIDGKYIYNPDITAKLKEIK